MSMLCFKTQKDVKLWRIKCLCLTLSNVINAYMQNLIGSYASTHRTFNLIGPCKKHLNIQSHKNTYAQSTDIWAIFQINSIKELKTWKSSSLTMSSRFFQFAVVLRTQLRLLYNPRLAYKHARFTLTMDGCMSTTGINCERLRSLST